MTYSPFDVVITPFPYADRAIAPVRPGVILTDWTSFGSGSGVALIAMVTSAAKSDWPLDVPISDLAAAGLNRPCKMRMKINAVELRLIGHKIGHLSEDDRRRFSAAFAILFPFAAGT